MTTAVTKESNKRVARPLRVLAALIKEDLKHGREASAHAGMPYYRAAGEKLIEARDGHSLSMAELCHWSKSQFDIGRAQTHLYMRYANATAGLSSREAHPSLHQHRVDSGVRQNVYPQPWHDPVKKIVGRVDLETLRDAELKRSEERDAERKLALQLIDIGYKTLATKLHPDKGGSRDAMARLNRVRDRLKVHV